MKRPAADLPPWLDYSGQSTRQLLACRATHRADSILAAFGTALAYKAEQRGKWALSAEERVLLAILALEAEVNNGGYSQFFFNSSRQYASRIVRALESAGCCKVAAITAKAIAALGLSRLSARAVQDAVVRRSKRRDAILDECDEEFYALTGDGFEPEIETALIQFVELNRAKFVLEKGYRPPVEEEDSGTGYSAISEIHTDLEFTKISDPSPAGLRKLARRFAASAEEPVKDGDIDAAVALFQFSSAAEGQNPAAAERYAENAFDLARQETSHCVAHHMWIESLLETGHTELADTWTLRYLEFIPESGAVGERLADDVDFWADLLRGNRGKMPRSAARFDELFPSRKPAGRRKG